MFNTDRLRAVLTAYKKDFDTVVWPQEGWKWKVVKWFQDHWNIEDQDFTSMLATSLKTTGNLLMSSMNFPRDMIQKMAKENKEEVRNMFTRLFDEQTDVYERIKEFKSKSFELTSSIDKKINHYQSENAISVYLWLRYPNKYYIYKFSVICAFATEIEADYKFNSGAYADNIRNFMRLYNEVTEVLKEDHELVTMLKAHLDADCYPDPELRTLAVDVGYYAAHRYRKASPAIHGTDAGQAEAGSSPEAISDGAEPSAAGDEPRGWWWLAANPKIWSFAELGAGEAQSYSLLSRKGCKRRIYRNFLDARPGDLVIGYETAPAKQIVALAKVSQAQNGEEIVFEKLEGLAVPLSLEAVKACPALAQMEFLKTPQGSLFKLTKEEYEALIGLIREENPEDEAEAGDLPAPYSDACFLSEVYMSRERFELLKGVLRTKKNVILQGAPGVGKTFATRRLAWALMGEKDDSRIEFVQFHQNYAYEDFVMGYKPSGEGFELKYGVFYRFCQKAANQPGRDFFFIIDEINRGNASKIFGELLMLIEASWRGITATLAYSGLPFAVPSNLYLVGMMNTADRSLAMIAYALRRRFSFFEMRPGFDAEGFAAYRQSLASEAFDRLVEAVRELNAAIAQDRSLGKGFCIGHSFLCGQERCTAARLRSIVEFDLVPLLEEYWFDDQAKAGQWAERLRSAVQ